MTTIETMVTRKDRCQRGRKYLADRCLLSEFEQIGRGSYLFTLHIPPRMDEASARDVLNKALPGEHIVDATIRETPNPQVSA